MSNWTIFSNHGHVLVCLAQNSESRLRDVAADVGITERAVQKIVRDLQDAGMVSVTKHGRRNRYRIHIKQTLRHDLESHCTLGELVNFVNRSKPGKKDRRKAVADQPEPVKIKQVQSVPDGSEPPEPALPPSVAVDPETNAKKSAKSETENSIERQQGSLF